MSMSRLQSVVVTIAALTIAGYSFVPPWVEVIPRGGFRGRATNPTDAPRLVVTRPLGSWPLPDPPQSEGQGGVRIDYGRLALYYLSTVILVIPFFVWRRRTASVK